MTGAPASVKPMWTSLDRRPFAVDIIVGVVAFGFFGCLDVYRTGWETLPVVAIFALALVFRRLSPGIALATAWVGAAVQLVILPSFINGDVMVAVVIFATSLAESRLVRRLGLFSSLAGGVVASVKLVLITGLFLPQGQHESQEAFSRVIYFVGVAGVVAAALSLFWLLGTIAGTRRALLAARLERLEGDQELLRSELRVAQETERTRIAREMHDVIGHSLAVIIAQSDGARYAVAKNPEAAGAALQVINASARAALDDVGEMLSVLAGAEGHEGSLGIADLEGLVQGLRSSGLDIVLAETGDRVALSTAGDLALYRVVQEALTNALKHGGPGTRVDVAIAWAADGVFVTSRTTEDDSPGLVEQPSGAGRRGGHGLAGMVERIRLVGGTLETGPRVDGVVGFGVAARIPRSSGGTE